MYLELRIRRIAVAIVAESIAPKLEHLVREVTWPPHQDSHLLRGQPMQSTQLGLGTLVAAETELAVAHQYASHLRPGKEAVQNQDSSK